VDIRDLTALFEELVYELETHLPYVAAFAAASTGRSVTVDLRNRRVSFERPTAGAVLTAFTGRHFVEVATSDLTAEGLRRAAAELREECDEAGVDRTSDLVVDPGDELHREFYVHVDEDPDELSLEQMLSAAAATRDRIHALSPHFAMCGVRYGYMTRTELFVNRARKLYQELPRWDSMWYGVLRRDGASVQVHGGDSRPGGAELMVFDEEQAARKIGNYERILGAPRLPDPGVRDCIFSPGVSGLTAHEAFGHGTETDMYLKGRAKGRDFTGRRVAAPGVTMYDSPARPGLPGSFFFDHEGTLAADTQIIDDGILVHGLTDVNSALRMGYTRTPNGRRESFAHKVYARMTNTYFGPGTDSLDAMLASIDHGYLIGLPQNGMEDPKGWGIQCEALLARRIENGVLTDDYYTPVVITGYVPDLLESITHVGDELQFFTLGACGKGKMKEFVRVSYGGPFLRLRARIA